MPLPTPRRLSWIACLAEFAAGRDTPSAFLDRCLANIETYEPQVGAFVHIEIAAARAQAQASSARWRAGAPLSRIDGMPVGIKDLIETADMPTQCGSPVYEGWRSERDAASVLALRQAGAVILGKTVTTEFAAKVPRGTRNPWDPARTPGGSSSGSAAAVGCGMLPVALGTQVIGSLLRPSSYCGAYGFKPTFGAINRGGSHDALSQSAHGPIAASLADAWVVAREIADRAGGDPGYPGLLGPAEPPVARKPVCVAVLETAGWKVADAPARALFEQAVAKLAAEGVKVITRANHRGVALLETSLERAGYVSHALVNYESVWPLNAYRARDASKLSSFLRDRLVEAEKMTPAEYRALLTERTGARAAHAALVGDCDVMLTLDATGVAPLGIEATGDTVFNIPASYLGAPALNLPVFMLDGLPLGLQVIGPVDGDAGMFAAASWIDAVLG
jgi:Asp-tRNA(Asn)/Glu-tRNA(Gln) amidotransferase A subunit family amidase